MLCEVRNEPKLHKARDKLLNSGIKLKEFYEPDRDNELTAICTEAITGEQRRIFKDFQLLRGEQNERTASV